MGSMEDAVKKKAKKPVRATATKSNPYIPIFYWYWDADKVHHDFFQWCAHRQSITYQTAQNTSKPARPRNRHSSYTYFSSELIMAI